MHVLTGHPWPGIAAVALLSWTPRTAFASSWPPRRARLTPNQAGLTSFGGTRRVPGLRRAEVALLAGITCDYYTRLERGNLSGVSDSVLDPVAGALHLDDAERCHLYNLARTAGTKPRPRRRPRHQVIRPEVQSLLDAMTDAPAFVRNGRLDVLAINRLGEALYRPAFRASRRPVTWPSSASSTPQPRTSTPTGKPPPIPPSRCCAPKPATTRMTQPSATWLANWSSAVTTSVPAGRRTTSACTPPESSTSSTRSSAGSAWCSRPCCLPVHRV